MLKNLFGSSKATTKAAPHAQFIYLSHDLQRLRAELGEFMLGDGGIALVSGEHGIGKTFLLQLLANDLENVRSVRQVVSLSCNFGYSGSDLLRRFCEKLGVRHSASLAAGDDTHLRRSLKEGLGKDDLVVLLVDEVQNLGDAELEHFVSLTDLHAGEASNLRIVLAGRPEVETAFNRAARRYRRQYVRRCAPQPLQRQEIAPFIAAWLRAQGRKRDNRLFTPEAVERIARRSSGVPGAIIELCATALLLAADSGHRPFDADDIDDAADYLRLDHAEALPGEDRLGPDDEREDEHRFGRAADEFEELEEDEAEEDEIDEIDEVDRLRHGRFAREADDPRHERDDIGAATAIPLPPPRPAAPSAENPVVLPFASEPGLPERSRPQLPARERPASPEQAVRPQTPESKHVIQLDPAEFERMPPERLPPERMPPKRTAPEPTTSKRTTSERTTSERIAPEPTAPKRMAAERPAPSRGARPTEHVRPERVRPERARPEPAPTKRMRPERGSPHFSAWGEEVEGDFVAGPRPTAAHMHPTRRRRRGGRAVRRIAAVLVIVGALASLPVIWAEVSDQSAEDMVAALLGLSPTMTAGEDAAAPEPATVAGNGRQADDGMQPDRSEPLPPPATTEPSTTTEMDTASSETTVPVPSERPAPAAPAAERADAAEPPPLPVVPGAEDAGSEAAGREIADADSAEPEPAAPTRVAEPANMPQQETQPTAPAPEQAAEQAPAPTEPEERIATAAPDPAPPEPAAEAAAPELAESEPVEPEPAEPAAAEQTTAVPPAEVAAAPEQAEDDVPAPSSQEQVASVPADTAVGERDAASNNAATGGRQAAINALLARARGQIEDYALTTPEGNNALETYQEVLRIAPGHQQALQGIRDIAEMYLRLAAAAERSGDVARTQRYREKAAELAPDHPAVVALRRSEARQAQAEQPATRQAVDQPAAAPSAAGTAPATSGDSAGRLAAASDIIKLLQERFGQSETAPPAPAPERQTAAAPSRAADRQPTGPMSLAAFDEPGGVEAAIAQGRDVNTRFADGRTPLIVAAARGEAERVRLLLANGARPDARTGDAATALMYAAWNGDTLSTEALLEHGADANARNVDGKTALMAAATNGHTGTAAALMQRGAAVNARANNGWTALMYAAWTGRTSMAQLLLQHRADPALANREGSTAAELAAERGHAALADMLREHPVASGSDVSSVRTANRNGG